MSYNGSGVFDPPALPNYPAVSGEVIYANRFNAVMQEIFNGLSQCITKDGQQTLTGDINFSNRKLLNVSRIIQGTLSDNGNALQIAGNANFDGTVAFTGTVTIAGGNATQYRRGDNSWQTLNKAAVGLPNVDDTSDSTKNAATATLSNKTLTAPLIDGMARFLNAGNTVGAVTPMPNYSCIFEADPGSLGDTSTYLNLNVQDNTILQLKSGSATFSQPVVCDDGITTGGTLAVNGGITLGTSLTNTSTPVASGASTAGSGTYSQQLGLWARYGNAVHFTLYIYWTAHTGTGQIRISLPFTSNASAPPVSCTIDVAGGALLTSDAVFKALISPNTNYIKISKYTPSTGSDAVVNMTASAIITISGTFFV